MEVETDIAKGLPAYTVVGLPGGAVRESDDRIRAAIRNSGLPFPGRKVTVNLAPADLRKDGALLDLPIALSVLCAEGVLPGGSLGNWLIAGELSLDGCVRPIRGALSQALLARNLGIPGVITPAANGEEARLVPEVRVAAVRTLREAAGILSGEIPSTAGEGEGPFPGVSGRPNPARPIPGIPRTWPTSWASRWPGALWKSRRRAAMRCYWWDRRAAGKRCWRRGCRGSCRPSLPRRRSKRPGSTARPVSPRGPAPSCGGRSARPIPRSPRRDSWAAGTRRGRGRFRSPMAECCSSTNSPNSVAEAREALRQPIESGEIRISRAGRRHRFPCRFLLLAASNPCPCGNAGHPRNMCRCSPQALERFARKFSGPLLDRIDLSVSVPPLSVEAWSGQPRGESTVEVRRRVDACRLLQEARYAGRPHRANGTVRAGTAELLRELSPEARNFLMRAAERLSLSGRSIGKACRVARTIADLAGESRVGLPHVAEGLQFRMPVFGTRENHVRDRESARELELATGRKVTASCKATGVYVIR